MKTEKLFKITGDDDEIVKYLEKIDGSKEQVRCDGSYVFFCPDSGFFWRCCMTLVNPGEEISFEDFEKIEKSKLIKK